MVQAASRAVPRRPADGFAVGAIGAIALHAGLLVVALLVSPRAPIVSTAVGTRDSVIFSAPSDGLPGVATRSTVARATERAPVIKHSRDISVRESSIAGPPARPAVGGGSIESRGGALVVGADADDWYLALLQGRISEVWRSQPSIPGPPVVVELTIAADGTLVALLLVESSGTVAIDMAAQRSVRAASPFAPLPPGRGSSFTVRAIFKPEP